ncbi:DUF7146 domain-containing protein [Ancylobacter sp. SL191]|uniref:DUF7146 domain-containing protein n=1 Tax=Ancylobacter sp. SL191 TaxID=2995166 RepID=UPI00226E34F5|nr:CHC2 zinc finger domain-containing protein [Ancylobacter sp. SL191]WAC26408.1 CHC2 zinc finger domain-containing protein [Ancylobacter sp. SL191]
MISEAALADLRRRNPVAEVAGKWVSLRKSSSPKWQMAGPCPIHSLKPHAKDSTAFVCDAERWVCAGCGKAGDVIALVMEREHKSFPEAVEWLGGVQDVDPAEEARRAAAAAEKKRQQDAATARYREEERERLHRWWKHGQHWRGTPVETYLREVRGVEIPATARLRYRFDTPFTVVDGKDEWGNVLYRVIHRGPAMLGAITAPDGRFSGLHITWLDLARPKGKAVIVDPKTGEVQPAKKMRGTKQGCVIELLRCASPHMLVAGEGIETVLSVYTARLRRGLSMDGIAMWAAGDLGNLAGAAAIGCSERHPDLKDAAGRTRRVPGATPDFDRPAMVVPDSVGDLRLLADGDSDPFSTRLVMDRAVARHAREGRRISVAWPQPGLDFDDMRRAARNAGQPAEVA